MSSASDLPEVQPRDDVTLGGLPSDVLEQAARRVRYVPLLAAVVYLVALGLLTTVTTPTLIAFHQVEVCAAGLTACVAFAAFLRWGPLTSYQTVEAGLFFQAFVALSIAWLEMPRFVVTAYTTAGISGLCVWQLLFPALIPVRTWKLLIASTGTSLMLPAVSKTLATAGVPVDEVAVGVTTMPVAVCGLLGVVVGRIVYDLGRSVGEARLMGNYELVRRLRRGGMGEVWRAEHRLLARPAAVKLIRPELLARAGEKPAVSRARFEREARATATLKSPHTVELYDYGVGNDGSFFYVMELLDGLTLRELVEDTGPLPPGRVIHIVRQACASLQEAHARGLVHRDVKPANILVCLQGTSADFVKVLDFGLVKPMTGASTAGDSVSSISAPVLSGGSGESSLGAPVDATLAGTLRGTPETMAPETILGQPVDHRADIYALGCIGYYLLTGKKVFSGNLMAVLWGHRAHLPVSPSDRVSREIPRDLEDVVLACLEKDPERRPQSARALAEALNGCEHAHSWTDSDAEAWWRDHRASGPPVALDETVSLSQLAPGPDKPDGSEQNTV